MADDIKNLVRAYELAFEDAAHIRHPLNPNSEVYVQRLSDRVGMKRAQLSLARVPPGKESFVPHGHLIQEEFLFILDGHGLAQIGGQDVAVGPGDYLGFPTDGTTHHLINIGETDLVYLMGGERSQVEVSHFSTLGKFAVMIGDRVNLFDEKDATELHARAWLAEPPRERR